MRVQSVTLIAATIVILSSAASGLLWIAQGGRLAPVNLINGAGIGCALAGAWVLCAVILSMLTKRS